MRSLLLAVLLAVATLAPVTARASDFAAWEQSDRRATNVARTGLIISTIGLGMSLGGVGLMVAGEGSDLVGTQLAIFGQLGLYLGPPLLAGGSLRSRRALNELGAGGPGPTGGTVAWALWGVSLALPGTVLAATADDPSGVILYGVWLAVAGGSVLAGAMQMEDNARYRAKLPGMGSAPAREGGVFVWVTPAVGPRSTGLRLAGLF